MIATSPSCEASLAAAHVVLSSSSSLLSTLAPRAVGAAAAVGASAAAVHPALAPLGAAATLRAATSSGATTVHIVRTQRRGDQRRATKITSPKKLPRAYSDRVHEFAAAAEHVLSDSFLSDEPGPPVLRSLRGKRCSSTDSASRQQRLAEATQAPWVFSMALQTSLL